MATVRSWFENVDVEALAHPRPADKRKHYGLRHKPTGLWFHSEGISAKRYFTSPDPFPRPKSACSLWRNNMQAPDDWEIVELAIVIAVKQ